MKLKARQAKKIDYGRRVRNITYTDDDGARAYRSYAVLPHTGPKPTVYPQRNWTPLSWRLS